MRATFHFGTYQAIHIIKGKVEKWVGTHGITGSGEARQSHITDWSDLVTILGTYTPVCSRCSAIGLLIPPWRIYSQFLCFGVILSNSKLEHPVGWSYFTYWCSGCQEAEKESLAYLILSWMVGSCFPPRLTQSNRKSIGVWAAIRVNVHYTVTRCKSLCGTVLRTGGTGKLCLPCNPGYFFWDQDLPNRVQLNFQALDKMLYVGFHMRMSGCFWFTKTDHHRDEWPAKPASC